MSLTVDVLQLDRRVKLLLRSANHEELGKEEETVLRHIKQLCNEARLDVRDYEYAETKAAQAKAAVSARKNLLALEKNILRLGTVFGPADVAELSAHIGQLTDGLS